MSIQIDHTNGQKTETHIHSEGTMKDHTSCGLRTTGESSTYAGATSAGIIIDSDVTCAKCLAIEEFVSYTVSAITYHNQLKKLS